MKEEEKLGVKVKDFTMVSHMAFTNKHLLLNRGMFLCEGKFLHEKYFTVETSTPYRNGNPGKGKSICYLAEPKSKQFKTLKELIEYYNKDKV